ncbi:MAG: YraN family protein [Pseudomonadota bacterium]|nr:YraN family protein [Pseudomonadota bacterium]
MSQDPRHSLGSWGEDLAALYLENQGLKIVERGFRCRFGEIDIIAQNSEVLIFCEVKTRRRESFIAPQEAVSWSKQRRLIKTAGWYLNQCSWDGELRFDVIAILAPGGREPIVEWIQDAFAWE